MAKADTVFFQSSRIKTIGVIKINYPRMSHFPSSEAPCPTTEKLNIFQNEQRKGKDYEKFFCFLQKLSEKGNEFEKSRKKWIENEKWTWIFKNERKNVGCNESSWADRMFGRNAFMVNDIKSQLSVGMLAPSVNELSCEKHRICFR